MTHSADLARMRAEADQNKEAMREMGRSLRGFYEGLAESGFNAEQALALTQVLLTNMLQAAPAASLATDLGEFLRGMGDES